VCSLSSARTDGSLKNESPCFLLLEQPYNAQFSLGMTFILPSDKKNRIEIKKQPLYIEISNAAIEI
jgi:hypothetical protein